MLCNSLLSLILRCLGISSVVEQRSTRRMSVVRFHYPQSRGTFPTLNQAGLQSSRKVDRHVLSLLATQNADHECGLRISKTNPPPAGTLKVSRVKNLKFHGQASEDQARLWGYGAFSERGQAG